MFRSMLHGANPEQDGLDELSKRIRAFRAVGSGTGAIAFARLAEIQSQFAPRIPTRELQHQPDLQRVPAPFWGWQPSTELKTSGPQLGHICAGMRGKRGHQQPAKGL
jgi:hypothetical protein